MAVLAIVAAAAWLWEDVVKDRLVPRRFGVVEQGAIYRSGQLHPALVERTLRDNGIDVVVSLIDTRYADAGDLAADRVEQAACDALGIDRRVYPLLGDGTGEIESYARAIAAMAESARGGRQVLVHCAAGSQRTGGAVAAYRVLVQGWEPPRACAEMAAFDWDPVEDLAVLTYLNGHMRELATRLVELGVIPAVPDPLPVLAP